MALSDLVYLMENIVAFVGFKASGKNTAAEALYDYTPISFADALKDALAAIFCWDRHMLEGITAESRRWREEVDPWWAERLGIPHFTPRFAMTNFGTEVMRRHFHEEIWVHNVERRMINIDGNVVILDVRFPNEAALARKYNAKIFRVQRGPEPWWIPHAMAALEGNINARLILSDAKIHESEWAWLDCPVDAVIQNNGSIADLHEKVQSLVTS